MGGNERAGGGDVSSMGFSKFSMTGCVFREPTFNSGLHTLNPFSFCNVPVYRVVVSVAALTARIE